MALIAASLTAGPALASTIDLAPPGIPPIAIFLTGGGDSRSFVFTDNSATSLTSVGIRIDPLQVTTFSLTTELFAYDLGTSTRGALLATGSGNFTDLGATFYDIAIALGLTPGQSYELNIHPSGGSFGNGPYGMEFYQFQNNPGPNTAYVAGPITVIDGSGDGDVLGRSNALLAHFRISEQAGATPVPEPSSLLLLGSGLAVGLRVYRNRAARR
jgi:hypothetical protein